MTHVVKVQVPIAGNGPRDVWMIYDEGCTNIRLQPPTPAMVKAMGDDLKGYFIAELVDGQWVVSERTKDRPW